MTAVAQFFCSPEEEAEVVRYLTKEAGTKVFDVRRRALDPWDDFSADSLPDWAERLSVFIWRPDLGPLVWHTSQPIVEGPTHGNFVANVFAREEWDRRELHGDDKLLDVDLSPLLCYRRGNVRNGLRAPNHVLAQPSSLARAGRDYEAWVKRSLAWVKRRGKLIHDHRKCSSLPNPDLIVSPIYAFAGAQLEIESGNHGYALFVDDDA